MKSSSPGFPKLCATAHQCASKETEVFRESFMLWQNAYEMFGPM